MKKYINDKSPFPNSLDEMDGQVLIFEGHDRPRYIYPFNNEAGYLGLDDWSQYWNKPTFNQEGIGELDSTKYYSIIVVPYKSDISAGGLPIMGEPTQRSIPVQPTAGLKSIVFNIPTHDQQVIKDCGIAYEDGSGTMTDESKTGTDAWVTDAYVGKTLKNVETGLSYTITANTGTVITATDCVFSSGDRYQILSDTVTGRFIYAAEMPSSDEVLISSFYLVGIIENNTATTYTLDKFFEGADIWDFSAGYFQPPNANCVKNVSGIMFCGGGIIEESGLAEYIGTVEVRAATASEDEEITISYVDDTYPDADLSKIIRITLGSEHDPFSDIHVGSYVSISGASNPLNNVESSRVLRVDPDGMWIEFKNNDAVIDATITASTPILTTSGDGTVDAIVTTSKAISESWVLTCIAGSFAATVPVITGGSTGDGTITTPVPNEDAQEETWTLTCTQETNTYSAGTVTKSGGSWTTAPIPTLKSLAVAESWEIKCVSKRLVPSLDSWSQSGVSTYLAAETGTPTIASNATISSTMVFTVVSQTNASSTSASGYATFRPTVGADITIPNNTSGRTISSSGVSVVVAGYVKVGSTYYKWDVGDYITVNVGSTAGGGSSFSVIGTVSGSIGFLTSGTPFVSDYFNITIQDGTTAWEEDDTVSFTVSEIAGTGAKFSVVGSLSGVKANLTSGQPYSNSFFSIQVSDGDTKWREDDEITFDIEATEDASAFSVVGDRSGTLAPLTIDELYTNDYFSTTVNSDDPTWQVGDSIFFTTTKAFEDIESTTLQASVVPNYIKGVLAGVDSTNFSEGMVDSKFMFSEDRSGSYTVSWVDSVAQKIGLGSLYTGNNEVLNSYKISSSPSLYYSDTRNPHRVRAGAIVDIGDSITGISSVGDNVLVFCKSSLWRVSVESLGSHPVLISDNIRCPAQFSIVKGERLVAFYDGTGISVTDGVTATSVTSYKAKDYLANINKAYEANIVGVYDRENRRFEFMFPMGDETQNNYGLYVTEGSWNCYPFSRPDCNALWTNYDSGSLRVYHGTTGELPDSNGVIWKHDGSLDGTVSAEMTMTAISDQTITVSADASVSLEAGDAVTIYPVISGEAYQGAIIESITTLTEDPYTYDITFSDLYDLTAYEAGDLIYAGYVPFDYGIKWTDFSSPQYRHQLRNIQIDLENMTGKLYVDHFLDMSETAVVTNEYDVTPADTKITVPFRMGKCYKYGFRLRGVSSTQMKISAFELMFDTQV